MAGLMHPTAAYLLVCCAALGCTQWVPSTLLDRPPCAAQPELPGGWAVGGGATACELDACSGGGERRGVAWCDVLEGGRLASSRCSRSSSCDCTMLSSSACTRINSSSTPGPASRPCRAAIPPPASSGGAQMLPCFCCWALALRGSMALCAKPDRGPRCHASPGWLCPSSSAPLCWLLDGLWPQPRPPSSLIAFGAPGRVDDEGSGACWLTLSLQAWRGDGKVSCCRRCCCCCFRGAGGWLAGVRGGGTMECPPVWSITRGLQAAAAVILAVCARWASASGHKHARTCSRLQVPACASSAGSARAWCRSATSCLGHPPLQSARCAPLCLACTLEVRALLEAL